MAGNQSDLKPRRLIKYFLPGILIFFGFSLRAQNHLVAGTISYTCLGVRNSTLNLRVTMSLIRDCYDPDIYSNFDSPTHRLLGTGT